MLIHKLLKAILRRHALVTSISARYGFTGQNNIYKNKNDGSYICEEFPLLGGEQSRAWWNPGGFSEKWYLSAFPQNEINKGYGLIQNPGWE